MSPLTDAQHNIVTALGTNCCVTSGAGCGKTRVLVARYLHVLEQDPDVPLANLAAITFTENAAAQMRDRIRAECRRRIADARRDHDAVCLARWRQRYWDVDVAPIATIHGFCSGLLRQWPIEAGVDPNFATLDETEAAFLRQDTVAATIERLLEAEDAHLLTVLEHFRLAEARAVLEEFLSGRRDALTRVADPALARSDEEILAALKKHVDETVLACLHEAAASPEVVQAVTDLRRVAGDAADKLEAVRSDALVQVTQLAGARTAAIALAAAQAIATGINLKGGSKKKWPSKHDMDAAKDALRRLRDAFKAALKDLPTFDEATERRHLALARALAHTASRVTAAYDAAKRERSALDFDDLQIRARDMLRDQKRVRDACRRRFRTILVDELQDTNALQFEIVELLTTEPGAKAVGAPLRPGALFAVGDPKQSIYRFRGAQVEVFDEARRRVSARGRKGLPDSFRLHPGTAGLVNRVFAPLMGKAYEPVRGVATQANDTVAEVIHVVPPPGSRGFRAEEGYAEQARALAARLKAIVRGGEVQIWDREAGAARPVRWGDVALLLRRTTHLHVYEHALEAEAVPYYVVAGRGFYKQQEVLDVLHLLHVLEDPTDDLHLAGVLRSPFFAVSDEGLYRLKRPGSTLHEALAQPLDDALLHPDDRRGLQRAAEHLRQWTAVKDALGLGALVERVVFDSGYAAAMATRFGGERAYANLRQMSALARTFEQQGLWALGDFIGYVADSLANEMQAEQAPIEAPGTNAVRLMTIHKAKGLEFPVVVLPDMAYTPRVPHGLWMISPHVGLAVRLRDEAGDRATSAAMAMARRNEADGQCAESHRLFYVAMTRAQDYLIFGSHEPYTHRTTGQRSWRAELLDALGAHSEAAEQRIAIAEAGHVLLRAEAPSRRRTRHGHRRVGPRGILAAGRVQWDQLTERPSARDRQAAAAWLGQVEGVPTADTAPRTITATALATYRRCPRRYWWQHVLGLTGCEPTAADALSPRRYGTLCHRAMELALGPDEATVGAAVDMALRDVEPGDARLAATRVRLLEAIRGFWHSPLGQRVAAADPANVHREVPFVLALQNTEVRGTIDLLFLDADGAWEVIDYKTARPPASADVAQRREYNLQLGLYALAASRWQGRPPKAWGVYYLSTGTYAPHPVAPSDLEETAEAIRETVAQLATKRYNRVLLGGCKECEFRGVCEPPADLKG